MRTSRVLVVMRAAAAQLPLLGISALLIGGVAADAQTAQVYLLRRGTLVDTFRGASYVAKAGGSIQAVALVTGAALWTSRSASLPIGASDSYVAGQAEISPFGTLAVVFLDVRNGVPVSEANIPLPASVQSMVSDSSISGFFLATAVADGSDFKVSWYYDDRVFFGVERPLQQFAGSARVDPRSGTVLTFDGGLVTGVPAWFNTYGGAPAQPWQSGGVTASTSVGSGGSITLKRTSTATGQQLPDVLLSSNALVAVPSFDAHHVVVVERGPGAFSGGYRNLTFAIDTGGRIGDFIDDHSLGPFVVFGGAIITTTQSYTYGGIYVPLSLVARLLPTGAQKWSVTRRDPAADGAAPKVNPPRGRAVRH
jgi:hypothetical protein